MSMHGPTRESLYFAYHRVVRRDRLPQTYRRVLQEDQERVAHLALLERLLAVLSHAKNSVPYYRDLMADRGPLPDLDGLPEYLASLPILTKDEIQRAGARLLSDDAAQRRTYTNMSGGSTGEPVQITQDQDYWDMTTAVQMVYSASLGRRFGERELYISADRRLLPAGEQSQVAGTDGASLPDLQGWPLRMANFVSRRELFNAYQMRPADIVDLLRKLDANPPRLIVSYAQAAYEIARFARENEISVRPQQALLCTAETLHDFMREEIESVFGDCAVYNRYGSHEVGDIGGECEEHGVLHVFPWTVYVEVVDDDGRLVPPGTPGNVLVTSLANLAMPLIRYAIGDRATLAVDEGCACGRKGQALAEILGRSADMFRLRDGSMVGPEYFIDLLRVRPWIERFQVVQHEYERVEILAELAGAQQPAPKELDGIRQSVQGVMGRACGVEFSCVTHIDSPASGKHRYVVSHVRGNATQRPSTSDVIP